MDDREARAAALRERIAEVAAAKEKAARAETIRLELARRQREEAIRYYRPHAKQIVFHEDTRRIRLVLGGNRSGKTQAGCSEDYAHLKGERVWFPEDHPARKIDIRIPSKGLIIGESFGEQVKKVLVPKLLGDPDRGIPGVIPKHEVEYTKRNQTGVITYIRLNNGSTIDFQSYDQDLDLFESTDYDFVHFDEPCPRAIWIAVQRGLTDRLGRSWMTMTPLKEPWIHDELVSRDDIGKHYFDMEDNIGFGLTREGVDEFSANLTEDEREARIHGRFFHLTGVVYKAYGPIHRVSRNKIFEATKGKVPPSWIPWFHVDTHARTPHHAIWGAIDPRDNLYVVGELINNDPGNLIGPFCEAIFAYEQDFLGVDSNKVERLIDPSSQINNPLEEGRTVWDEFAAHGVRCRTGSKNLPAGILMTHKRLAHEPKHGIYPTLFFMDDLRHIDKELRNYVWEEWSRTQAQAKTEKQKPRDKDDHLIEGLHRIILEDPRWSPQIDPESVEEPVSTTRMGY